MSSLAQQWAALSTEEREELLASMSDEEVLQLTYDWRVWARPSQILPGTIGAEIQREDWFGWLLLAGRGSGKTRSGAEAVKEWVGPPEGRAVRIALVAETKGDARDVLVEGESGLLSVCPPWNYPRYEPSKRRLTWANGSQAFLFSGDEPDQLRGPQFHKAWVDELAKYQYPQEVWDNLEFGLRLGFTPQVVVTTTPRPIKIVKDMMADKDFVVTRGSSDDNMMNLPEKYIRRVIAKYRGTRIGRQELDAEILDDVPGGLWLREFFDNNRIRTKYNEFRRVIVAIDPSTKGRKPNEKDEPNECGIIVAARGEDGYGHTLKDASDILSPDQWAERAIALYHQFEADAIVAEKNNGGEMVVSTIRTRDRDRTIPIKLVHASRGKSVRAQPISALNEQGRIKYHGIFPQLEDQLVCFTTDGYIGGGSPDRGDAYVWAMTDLMLGPRGEYDPNKWKAHRK